MEIHVAAKDLIKGLGGPEDGSRVIELELTEGVWPAVILNCPSGKVETIGAVEDIIGLEFLPLVVDIVIDAAVMD